MVACTRKAPPTHPHTTHTHLVHATRLPKYLHHFMQLSRTLQKTSVTAISSIFCKDHSPNQCLVHIYRENLLKMDTEGHDKDSIHGDCLSFYQKHVRQQQLVQALLSNANISQITYPILQDLIFFLEYADDLHIIELGCDVTMAKLLFCKAITSKTILYPDQLINTKRLIIQIFIPCSRPSLIYMNNEFQRKLNNRRKYINKATMRNPSPNYSLKSSQDQVCGKH